MKQIKKGDIYFADFKKGIGSEQEGIRPVIILWCEEECPTCIVVPITRKDKRQNTHIKVLKLDRLKCDCTILLEQIRSIDVMRLRDYKGSLNEYEIKYIELKLKEMLER